MKNRVLAQKQLESIVDTEWRPLHDIKGDLLGSSCSIKLNFPSSKAQIVAGKYLKTEEENDPV